MAEAIYTRIASDNQNDPRGGKIIIPDFVSLYWDAGYSGNNLNRPGLLSMIEDIEEGKINSVFVNDMEELSRSVVDTITLFGLFKEYGVEFYTVTPRAEETKQN